MPWRRAGTAPGILAWRLPWSEMGSELLGWTQPRHPRPRPSWPQRLSPHVLRVRLSPQGLAGHHKVHIAPWRQMLRASLSAPLLQALRPRVCSCAREARLGPVSGKSSGWMSELGPERPRASKPSPVSPAFRWLRTTLPPAQKGPLPQPCRWFSSALPNHGSSSRGFCSPGCPTLGLSSGQSSLSRSACFLVSPVACFLWI